MSSQPPASSLINAPPPKSSDVDAGDVDAATFYRDENKLDVGGARARGPKMTLTQLENLKKSQGNRDLDIGGARGEGIKLDLTEEEDDDAGDGAEPRAGPPKAYETLEAGDVIAGSITVTETVTKVSGGTTTSKRINLGAVKRAQKQSGAKEISIGKGGYAGGAILTIEETTSEPTKR